MACPDCDRVPATPLPRRDFLRAVGGSAATLAFGGATPLTPLARAARARAEKQAASEALVFELAGTLTKAQRAKLVMPWDQGTGLPARLAMNNAPVGKSVIGEEYTTAQRELLDRLFRSLGNGDEGYRLLSRGGGFDDSGDFESLGALIYGDPAPGKKFSLVFSGHHLTVRCDGNSEDGAAFGGPLYYGHSPNGYSDDNVFHHQTLAVREVFGALDGRQRAAAVLDGTPGEQAASVRFRRSGEAHPGIALRELSADQRGLVEKVMRVLVAPYRQEDGDEVMEVVKANGGLEKIHLAFYRDKTPTDKQPWHFWRLEGPGFVWNFRVLPHVHTFVHVSSRSA
jgi:hypothetical protein